MKNITLQWTFCHKNYVNIFWCSTGQRSNGREWFLPKFCLTLSSLNRLTNINEFSYQNFQVCVFFSNRNSFVHLQFFFVNRVDGCINKMKLLNICTVFDGSITLCFGQYGTEDITAFDINRNKLLTFILNAFSNSFDINTNIYVVLKRI